MNIGAFNNSLARTESGGRYDVVNSEGYGGKYQFGQARLDDFNNANGTRYSVAELVQNPELQEAVQRWHVSDIDRYVKSNGLDQYIGQAINGQVLSQDSLRAMAHLGGKSGMRRFLQSGGAYNPSDSNGTSLLDYARTHAGTPDAVDYSQNSLTPATGQPEPPRNALKQFQWQANYLNPADFMTPR